MLYMALVHYTMVITQHTNDTHHTCDKYGIYLQYTTTMSSLLLLSLDPASGAVHL